MCGTQTLPPLLVARSTLYSKASGRSKRDEIEKRVFSLRDPDAALGICAFVSYLAGASTYRDFSEYASADDDDNFSRGGDCRWYGFFWLCCSRFRAGRTTRSRHFDYSPRRFSWRQKSAFAINALI